MPKTRRQRQTRNARKGKSTRKGKCSRRGGSRSFYPSEIAERMKIGRILIKLDGLNWLNGELSDETIALAPEICEILLRSRFAFKKNPFYSIILGKLEEFKREPRLEHLMPLIDETIDHAQRARAGEFNSLPTS